MKHFNQLSPIRWLVILLSILAIMMALTWSFDSWLWVVKYWKISLIIVALVLFRGITSYLGARGHHQKCYERICAALVDTTIPLRLDELARLLDGANSLELTKSILQELVLEDRVQILDQKCGDYEGLRYAWCDNE